MGQGENASTGSLLFFCLRDRSPQPWRLSPKPYLGAYAARAQGQPSKAGAGRLRLEKGPSIGSGGRTENAGRDGATMPLGRAWRPRHCV
jgi:hypothetical protein